VRQTRRDFIKNVGWGLGSAALLEACTTLDQLFFGESADLRSKVAIIGAGLSGLLCAWELKKRKVPFVIFESSTRLGGQIVTLNSPAGAESFWVEMGPGQGFWPDNKRILSIIRELQLQTLELPVARPAKGFEAERAFSLWQWGLPPEELDSQGGLGQDSLKVVSAKTSPFLVIDKGAQRLIEALSGQLFGSFVEGYVRLQHEWIAVEPNGNHWDLIFRTPHGRRRFEVEQVIVAFNPWLLSHVKGAEAWVSWPGGGPLIPWSRVEQRLRTSAPKSEGLLRAGEREVSWFYTWRRKNVWGDVKSQESWLMSRGPSQTHVRPAFLRSEDSGVTLSWDWAWQKGVRGCSLPPVRRERCPSLSLPASWQHTHLWLRESKGEGCSSPWELCVWAAQQVAERVVDTSLISRKRL